MRILIVSLMLIFCLTGCGPLAKINTNGDLIRRLSEQNLRSAQENISLREIYNDAVKNDKNRVSLIPASTGDMLSGILGALADPLTGGPIGGLLFVAKMWADQKKKTGEATDLAKEVANMDPVKGTEALVNSKVKV